MRNLFLGFFVSLFLLMFIWLCIGFTRYGEDVLKVHLDLDKTVEQLIDLGDGELESAFDIIEIFNNTSDTLPSDLPNWLNKLASGIVVPFRVIFNVIKVLISFTTGIFKFVFNPIFA